MSKRIVFVFGSYLLAIGGLSGQSAPAVKEVAITPTSPGSGKDNFLMYCAVCHGRDAKGNGPAARALKKAPADLTGLTARNHGTFPELRVMHYIEGSDEVAAHGSRDMPVWGELFSLQNERSKALRLSNLVEYLKSIQAK